MRFEVLHAGIVATAILCSQSAKAASTFNASPSADAFVAVGPSGNLVNNNYGGAGALTFAPAGAAQGEAQSLLKFDLSSAVSQFNGAFGAGQWTLQSVTLQLTAAPGGNAIFNTPTAGTIGFSWMQNDSWVEGSGNPNTPASTGISFATLNSFLGASDENLGSFSVSGATSGALTYNFNLSPGFQNDIAAGGDVSLRFFAADATGSGIYDSRSFGTTTARPMLIVQAVPEPGPIALTTFGLILLAWPLRRARSC